MRPVERVLERLSIFTKSSSGWIARCPAHEDEHPSLSIAEGDDSRALLKCHAGCTVESVVAALGLEMRDLNDESTAVASAHTRTPPATESFATFEEVRDRTQASVRNALRAPYELVAVYSYKTMPEGELRVLRFEIPGGKKTFRQVSLRNGAWYLNRGTGKARPYQIEELEHEPIVILVEGEKCVEAVRSIRTTATTSAGGASAARRTDWSCLRGRAVVAFPDNDAPGQKYVSDVASLLGVLALPTVELPVGPGQDIADFIERRRREGVSTESIRDEVLAMAREQLDASTQHRSNQIPERIAFPQELLPEVVREFIARMATITCSDPSTLALSCLVAMSAAIGRSVKVRVTDEWFETCALWVAIVAASGRGKSHAMRVALRRIQERDADARRAYDAACAVYREQLERFQSLPPAERIDATPPVRPKRELHFVTDLTIEALIKLLSDNPRGLLYAPDELDSFFASLERYRQGGGSDRPQWLSLHSGGAIRYERKTSGNVQVEHTFVSMIGSIQPQVLGRNFQGEGLSSGLAARFLLYQPLPIPRVLRRKLDTRSARANFDALLERLYSIPLRTGGDDPSHAVELTDEAGELFERFVTAWDRRYSAESDDELRSASAKLEAYAVRIALILHVAEYATSGMPGDPSINAHGLPPISRRTMNAAINIVRWAMASARRTYVELRNHLDVSKLEARAQVLFRHGGNATVRDWQRARYQLTADQARAELDELVQAGFAEWVEQPNGPQGGRKTTVCRLIPGVLDGRAAASDGAGLPDNWVEESGSVDVDLGAAPDSDQEPPPSH